jgi:flagellar L-ring protein precursor FlgH
MKRILAMVVLSALAPAAVGQSLFTQQPAPLPFGAERHESDQASPLYGVSMIAVPPPRPRSFKTHDQVTIVVDEASTQQADQSLKTDKKYTNNATLNAIIDPWELLELRLQPSSINNLKLIDLLANQKFDGKGDYNRTDRLSMKIQAEIIDVKPNGVLVLEARKFLDKNGETQSTILSGSCRQEDITKNNTVFSSQLANLTLVTQSKGQVNDAGKKGLIPRVLETVFSF